MQCFNCNRLGHISRFCRFPRAQQQSNFGGRPYRGRFQHKVGSVQGGQHPDQVGYQYDEACGYTNTSCGINSIPSGGKRESPFYRSRKLSAVPGRINGKAQQQLLVDSGSPVTIIRKDLWLQVRDLSTQVEEEPEDFQGVTRDGLHIIGLSKLLLQIGGLNVPHSVLIADGIAHKFILGNDFMTEHKCDILNSKGAIQFGAEQVPFTLFRFTVNLICPVICSLATTIGPHEEAVFPALLDAASNYSPGDTLLLEPRNLRGKGPIIGARVLVNYTSATVPVVFANLSNEPITLLRNQVLADDVLARPFDVCQKTSNESKAYTASAVKSSAAPAAGSQKTLSPVQKDMANADISLSF